MKRSFITKIRKRAKKGFSLSEVLVVVAIIGILSALSFVSVISYQRDLARLEMDSTAKEIFLAAQEHLTIADGQNFLGLDPSKDQGKFGTNVEVRDENNILIADNVYYFVVSEGRIDSDKAYGMGTLLDQVLPFGSIEETVRTSGSYLIRYQTSPAQILDVFYTEPHGRYPHTFATLTQTEYDHLFNDCRTSDVQPRRNYDFTDPTQGSDYKVRNAVIGYYGGGNSDAAISGIRENGAELIAPILQVENGDRLVATVIDPNTIADTLTLHIKGLTSGADRTIVLHRQAYGGWTAGENPEGLSYVTKIDPITGHVTYEIVLDDITTPGGGFAQKFGPYGFIPGENIEIYADARDLDHFGSVAQSAKYTTNSLFADVEGDNIEITSLRHLENLDPDVSNFMPETLGVTDPTIEQTSDIDFNDFLDDIRQSKGLGPDGDVVIYKYDSNPDDAIPPEGAKPNTYIPITPDYHMDYDGKNNTVSNIVIDTKGDAGFFGTVSDPLGSDHSHITIKDLELVDFSVKSEDGNAGVLAGTTYNANISGVLVRNTSADPGFGVTAGGTRDGNAGGLVGEMNGGSINLCAASTYVRSTSPAGSATNDGNAGGLIGKVTSTVFIVNSYSGGHTEDAEYQDDSVNVKGNNSVGGFIGNAKEDSDTRLTVNSCYTTSSSQGPNASTAGFIGSANSNTNISNSYAAGKVYPASAGGSVNPFAGETSGGTFTNNYFLKGLNDKVGEENAAAAYSISDEDAGNPFYVENAARNDAVCYDKAITAKFAGRYTFSTISQLNPMDLSQLGEVAYSIATIHFGDWEAEGGIEAMDVEIDNGDEFLIDASTEDTPGDFTLVAVGKSSGTAVLYQFSLGAGNSVELKAIAYADVDGTATYYREGISNKYGEPIPVSEMVTVSESDGRTHFGITIDSITREGLHFDELFCTASPETGLIPGEDIRICVVSGTAEWADVKDLQKEDGSGELIDAYSETNSIFSDETETKGSSITAHISSLRHLQNLDSCVSRTNTIASSPAYVTAAVLDGHLRLDGEFRSGGDYAKIYASGTEDPVLNSFHAISNDKLRSFDGDLYTISGLVVDSTVSGSGYAEVSESVSSGHGLAAGLFGYVRNSLTVSDLRLYDPQILSETADGSVKAECGAIAGFVGGGVITLDTVAVVGEDGIIRNTTGGASSTLYDSAYAGGLIGGLRSADAVINNCAVSVEVESSSAAGGFIGRVSGYGNSVAITGSYVGGRTEGDAVYDTDGNLAGHEYRTGSKSVYNISSTSKAAGGFIGQVWNSEGKSTELSISDSFCAASVAAGANGGSIVGQAGKGTDMTLENVYTVAPVFNVRTGGTQTNGAFIGSLENGASLDTENCAYLAGIYEENYDPEGNISFDALSVKTIGGNSGLDPVIPVHYGQKSIISPNASTNCTKPVPYDSTLKNSDYPFSIWTSLPFRKLFSSDPEIVNTARTRFYYGDWQPLFSDENSETELDDSTIITVSLVIVQPDGTKVPITGYLSSQDILQKSGGDIVLPSIPSIGGFKPSGWYYDYELDGSGEYYGGSGTPVATGTGTATIPDAEDDPNRPTESFELYACYEPANTYEISFFYVDPNTGSVENLGSPKVYDGEATITNPPTRSFDDYRQKTENGHLVWYTNPEGTGTPIDVKNMKIEDWADEMGSKISLYAIYEKIDVSEIVIQFRYMPVSSTEKWNIPGLSDYVIEYEKGSVFKADITIPDLSQKKGNLHPDSATLVNASGVTVPCNERLNKTGLKFSVDSSAATRYTVIYQAYNTENNYVIHAVYHDSTTGLAYSAGNTFTIDEPGLGAAGYIPDISDTVSKIIDKYPGFYVKGYTNDKPIPSEGQLDIYIDFYREIYNIVFDGGIGTDLITYRLKYGEPLTSYKDEAKITVQKQRNIGSVTFTLNSWSAVRYSNNEAYTGSTMPAFDLLATANWGGTAAYKVYYWQQNADVKDAAGNLIYDYSDPRCYDREEAYSLVVADSLATYSGGIGSSINAASLANKNYTNYHLSTRNTPENVNNGVTIKSDGSTIFNIYYDRDIHSVYFVNGSKVEMGYDFLGTGTFSTNTEVKLAYVDNKNALAYNNTSSKYWTTASSGNSLDQRKYYYDGNGNYFQYSDSSYRSIPTYYYYTNANSSLESEIKDQMTQKGFYKETQSSAINYSAINADYYYDGSSKCYKNSGTRIIDGSTVYVYTSVSNPASSKINKKGFWKESSGSNVFSDLTITGRWGQDVHNMWPSQRTNVSNNSSLWAVAPGSSTWQAFINTVPITDMYFYKTSNQSTSCNVTAYLQDISGSYAVSADHSYVANCSSSNVTTKDDYPPITGFTILAYDSSDASSINSKFGAGTAKYERSDSAHRSTSLGSSFGRGVTIYYQRNSYTLYLSNVANSKTISNVKFGAAIGSSSEFSSFVPSAPAGYSSYSFGGWYDNSQCAGNAIDPARVTMPASDMILYAKWEPPVYSLSFDLNLPAGMSASDVTMTGTNPAQVAMKSTVSANPDLCDENGWRPAYRPTTSDGCEYKFKGWYTDPSGTMVFKPDAPVTGSMTVYAKWVSKTADLKVRHIWLDADGTEHDIAPVQTTKVNVDENLTISLHATNNTDQIHLNVNGTDLDAIDFYDHTIKYYQVNTNTVISHRIEGGSTSSEVAFYYNKYNGESWSYTVEYYAEYTNPDDPSDSVTVLLKTVNGGKADKHFKVVSFEMPSDMPGYHNTGAETCIVNQGNNKAIFYVAPDLTSLSLTAEAAVYDGTAHKTAKLTMNGGDFVSTSEATEEAPASIQAPAGGQISLRYNYTTGERDYVDFGSYPVTASIIYSNDSGRAVPIWTSEPVYIPVKKRTVTLESISYGWVYDGNIHSFADGRSTDEHPVLSSGKILTNVAGPAVYVMEEFDEEHGFIDGEGYSFSFKATAYITNEGQTQNSFSYTLNDNTLAKNYIININPGIIKVAGSFSGLGDDVLIDGYKVIYHANDGAETDSTFEQHFESGVRTELAANTFVRDGYSFSEWNSSPDGQGERSYTDRMEVIDIAYIETGIIDLYAQWEGNLYTVSFDANGGSGSIDPIEARFSVPFSLPMAGGIAAPATGTPMYQSGWSDTSDGTGSFYTPGEEVVNLVTSGSIKLYAQWAESFNYSIRFDKNNENAQGSMTDMTGLIAGADAALTANAFTLENYEFAGWMFAPDGLDAAFADGATINYIAGEADEVLTLYAKWTPCRYSVALEAGGAVIAEGKNVTEHTYTEATALPAAEDMTLSGRVFAGWYDNAGFSGSPVTEIPAEVHEATTWFAKWDNASYKVTLYANDGSEAYSEAAYTYGTGLTLTAPAEPEGRSFTGWFDNPQGTGTAVTAIGSDEFGDKTFYAGWTNGSYTITYVTNGGSFRNAVISSYTYGDVTDLPTGEDISKTGANFGGWYTDAALTAGPVTRISSETSGSMTFYAKWVSADYSIHYMDGTTELFALYPAGYEFSTSAETVLPAAEKNGYDFKGWYTSSSFSGSAVTSIPAGSTGDKTFYAKFEPSVYSITYMDGTEVITGLTPAGYTFGTAVFLPETYSKANSSFEGWYSSPDFSGDAVTMVGDSEFGDKVFYAKVTLNQYDITFDANGGSVSPSGKTVSYGESYGDLPVATRSDYAFLGWFTEASGGTKVESNTKAVSDQTLYAHWAKLYNFSLSVGNYSSSTVSFATADGGMDSRNVKPDDDRPTDTATATVQVPAGTLVKVKVDYVEERNTFSLKQVSGNNITFYSDEDCTNALDSVAATGDTTFYFIMPASNASLTTTGKTPTNPGGGSGPVCITGETLIARADGTQVMAKNVKVGDKIKAYDFLSGAVTESTVFTIEKYEGIKSTLITVSLDNGMDIDIINAQSFFDMDAREYFTIDSGSCRKAVGRNIMVMTEDGIAAAKITNITAAEKVQDTYEIITAGTYNFFAEGILTVEPYFSCMNIFEIDENYRYDAEKMAADIAKYGLSSYAEFEGQFSREAFDAYGIQYVKIALAKGMLTQQHLQDAIELFHSKALTNLCD